MVLYTVGHSTRSVEDLMGLLKDFDIQRLADVRTIPRSRRNPQFNTDDFRETLAGQGVEYRHFRTLGGLRKPHKDSVNQGWKNAAFRGYADYMQSAEFNSAVEDLLAWAQEKPTAVMCAEAVPWRCHRSLIADAAMARDVDVMHIMSPGKAHSHRMTSFARVEGLSVTYPFALQG